MTPQEYDTSSSSQPPIPNVGPAQQADSYATSMKPATLPQSSSITPSMAADNDLIEKDWVEAAKRIINDNKQDPYMQSKAMTALRQDYMKKRYGKDIRTAS